VAYNQQKNQQNNKHTHAGRLLTHSGQVCPTLIPSGHANNESQDASLHTVYASSHMFRGRDGVFLQHLLKDNLPAHYEALLGNVLTDYIVPNDFYTAITNAMDFAREKPTI
jgi:hypothetical protein